MPPDLADAERKAGYERRDPETNEPLKRGQMTREESRRWWTANDRRWRAWAFGPRPASGEWAWDERLGWCRVASKAGTATTKGART